MLYKTVPSSDCNSSLEHQFSRNTSQSQNESCLYICNQYFIKPTHDDLMWWREAQLLKNKKLHKLCIKLHSTVYLVSYDFLICLDCLNKSVYYKLATEPKYSDKVFVSWEKK